MDHVSGANFFNILQTVGSAAGLYSMMAPYFISFAHFVKDKGFNSEMLRRFNVKTPIEASTNVAYFTDTFFDINDIAITLQQQVTSAIQNEKEITVITCDDQNRKAAENIKTFKPVGVYELPDYDEQTLYFPPLMEMLHYCYENNFSRIHAATPGPIGLAGLIIAHILKLPISATDYTSLPLYAQMLTDDPDIEELIWKFVLWYYEQMDVIYVPTKSVKSELTCKGIRPEKIVVFPNVIDTTHFHPRKRNGFLLNRYNIRSKIKLLYVGQISKSKNLHILTDVYKALAVSTDNIHLIFVGDGSYVKDMKAALRNTPCTFTGYLSGEDLATVYASSDIFVFPSTTDTLGRAVMEAQASGLPAIVSDQGGPHDNVIPGETGLMVKGNDTISLLNAILTLIADPNRIRRMGHAARKYVEDRCLDTAFFEPGPTNKADSALPNACLAKAG